MTRPLPDVGDPEFAPFWAGAVKGKLVSSFVCNVSTPAGRPVRSAPTAGTSILSGGEFAPRAAFTRGRSLSIKRRRIYRPPTSWD